MNEQLQEALSQLIEKSMVGVENSLDFLSSEIPDVIYQLLMWYGVQSAVSTLIGLVLLLLIIPLNKKFTIPLVNNLEDYSEVKVVSTAALVVVNAVVVVYALNSLNLTWLKIWIAPKVWLLDYVASVVK